MTPNPIHPDQTEKMPPRRLLSVQEGAIYLSVSEWTVRDLVAEGKISKVTIRKRILIDVRDLDAYIDKMKVNAGDG